jgi:hypothetical protein
MRELQKPRPGLTLLLLLLVAAAIVAAVWIARTQSQDNAAEEARQRDVEVFREEGAGR